MIRWLVIALFLYLMLRLITGPKRKRRRSNPLFRFYYGKFPEDQQTPGDERRRKPGAGGLDQVEEADYEDITDADKEISEKKVDT